MKPSKTPVKVADSAELLASLAAVPEPRRAKSVDHPLHELLFVARCGAVAGCAAWVGVLCLSEHQPPVAESKPNL